MKIVTEKALRDFEFWSGGADRAKNCSVEELDAIEEFLEEIEPEQGWTDTAINDMFWFEFDTLAQHLGYDDEEDFDRKHDPNFINDDELEDYIKDWFSDFLDTVKENEGTEGLMFILDEIFGEDYLELCETPEQKQDAADSDHYPDWLGELAYKCMAEYDASTLMYSLFYDDCGHDRLENFPTKEQFRSEMMTKRQKS